ncbi:MAG: hypothetical protein LUH05_02350 [Candidatus Gastranaerophilales bacterium]|nr:hypothetical protein [Candidatus Gastranaerophilales bacterium]
MIFDFLIKKHECRHTNVPIDVDEAYCPDCGALIRNQWFIIRCSCCNIKRKAHTEYNEIKPDTKYCPNCGGTDFYVQELEKLNFMEVRYAILKKVIIPQTTYTARQIWIEKEENQQKERKLLECRK